MSGPTLPDRDALLELLDRGLRAMGLEPAPGIGGRLLDFLALLLDWNRAFNLTAITDPSRMLTHHLLDSLSLVPHLAGQRILDVGSGAGLPGIPLALWFPGREFHLLDSNGKKARFLVQAKISLALDNVTVHHSRAEQFRDPAGYDCVLARAVSSLSGLVGMSGHLIAPGGRLLAMKADSVEDELRDIPPAYNVASRADLEVPGIAQRRQLVCIARNAQFTPTDG